MASTGPFDWRSKPMVSPHGGFMIQGRGGQEGNFEVAIPWPDGGLAHFVRDNDPELAESSVAATVHDGDVFIAWRTEDARINVAKVVLSEDPNGQVTIGGLREKVVLGDTTSAAPALGSVRGRLCVVWTGVGNNRLNAVLSHDHGLTFVGKMTFGDSSEDAPGLARHHDHLHITWKGLDGRVNVALVGMWANTSGGLGLVGIQNKVVLGELTDRAPALTSIHGRLFVAWTGHENEMLNVAFSDDGGSTFGGKVTFGDYSPSAPTLTAHRGALMMGWRGSDDRVNVAEVALTGTTSGGFSVAGSRGRVSLEERTDRAPALASGDGPLMLAWCGVGNKNMNFLRSTDSGATFGGKRTFGNSFRWDGPIRFGRGQYVGAAIVETDERFLHDRRLGYLGVLATEVDGSLVYYERDNAAFLWSLGGHQVLPPSGSGYSAACGPTLAYTGSYFIKELFDPQYHFPGKSIYVVPLREGGLELGYRFNPNDVNKTHTKTNPPTPPEVPYWRRLDSVGQERVVGLAVAVVVDRSIGGLVSGYADKGPSNLSGGPSVVAAVTDDGRLHLHSYGHSSNWDLSRADFLEEVVFGRDIFPELDGEFWGRPCILQGDYGYRPESGVPFTVGHFGWLELIVPSRRGGLIEFWHDCGNTFETTVPIGSRWNGGVRIAGPLVYDEVSFVESTFNAAEHGNFELIARAANQAGFDFYHRDTDLRWHGPQRVPDRSRVERGTWFSRPMESGGPAADASRTPTGWYSKRDNVHHVAYLGVDGLLYEQTRAAEVGDWRRATIAEGDGPGVADRSSLTSWYSEGVDDHAHHVVCVGADFHLHEYHRLVGTEQWLHRDVTAGGTPVARLTGPSSLVTVASRYRCHLVYRGADGEIHYRHRENSAEVWQERPLPADIPGAAPDVGPTCWFSSPDRTFHIAYLGTDGNIQELSRLVEAEGDEWPGRRVVGSAVVAPVTGLMSWWAFVENRHYVAHVGADRHVFAYSRDASASGTWTHQVVDTGALVAPNTSPTFWLSPPTDDQHVAFPDTAGLVRVVSRRGGGVGAWTGKDINAGGVLAAPGAGPTSWFSTPENAYHVAYIGIDGGLHEHFFFSGANGPGGMVAAGQALTISEEAAGLRPPGSTHPVDYSQLADVVPNEQWTRLVATLLDLARTQQGLADMVATSATIVRLVEVYERLAQADPGTWGPVVTTRLTGLLDTFGGGVDAATTSLLLGRALWHGAHPGRLAVAAHRAAELLGSSGRTTERVAVERVAIDVLVGWVPGAGEALEHAKLLGWYWHFQVYYLVDDQQAGGAVQAADAAVEGYRRYAGLSGADVLWCAGQLNSLASTCQAQGFHDQAAAAEQAVADLLAGGTTTTVG